VLGYCNPEIHHAMTAEIIESVRMLSADRFGNCGVQYLLEHRGAAMVKKFATEIIGMRPTSMPRMTDVIDKCLTFGCHRHRQLITSEIIAGDHIMVGDGDL